MVKLDTDVSKRLSIFEADPLLQRFQAVDAFADSRCIFLGEDQENAEYQKKGMIDDRRRKRLGPKNRRFGLRKLRQTIFNLRIRQPKNQSTCMSSTGVSGSRVKFATEPCSKCEFSTIQIGEFQMITCKWSQFPDITRSQWLLKEILERTKSELAMFMCMKIGKCFVEGRAKALINVQGV